MIGGNGKADSRKFVSTKQKTKMDTIERLEKAKEAYAKCQQVLKSVKILNQDLIGPYSQNDNLTGRDRSKAVTALSDADGNLSIALLHIEEAIRIITDGSNQ